LKIGLIAPPFLAVPPADYGGTELFVAHLAEALQEVGLEVVVYANGESTVQAERRWIYEHSEWPIKNPEHAWVRDLNHQAWAVHDAEVDCDIIHIQSPQALSVSRFTRRPIVLTLHGPHDPKFSEFYGFYPDVHYVCISEAQCKQESMPKMRTVHHGIDISQYRFVEQKQRFLSYIGRIAPRKQSACPVQISQACRKSAPQGILSSG
jgi:glycosyltransferase involved in cell wall biosynthesis